MGCSHCISRLNLSILLAQGQRQLRRRRFGQQFLDVLELAAGGPCAEFGILDDLEGIVDAFLIGVLDHSVLVCGRTKVAYFGRCRISVD